jgi:TatA/E family protein of Tat protein translocase
MEILGIGPLELVLILVVALLVFGPEKLPEIGANLGRSVRELRNMSREITRNVNTLVNEPVAELRKPIDETSQVVQSIARTADTVRNPAEALQRAIAGQLATQPAASTDAASPAAVPATAVPGEPAGQPIEAEASPAPTPASADPES